MKLFFFSSFEGWGLYKVYHMFSSEVLVECIKTFGVYSFSFFTCSILKSDWRIIYSLLYYNSLFAYHGPRVYQSLPQQSNGNVCIHSTRPRVHLWDFTGPLVGFHWVCFCCRCWSLMVMKKSPSM